MKKQPAPAPEVKVGQVWKDLDPRMTRHIKILALEIGVPYGYDRAVVQACLPNGQLHGTPKSRIRLSRLLTTGSRGYALVLGVQ